MRRAIWTGLLGVLMVTATLPVRAAEEASSGKAYVVLVGVSNYADKQIKPRAHAEDDARALYDLFINKDYLGAGADQVRLLLGAKDAKRPSELATRENILKSLTWAATSAKKDDLVVFAFFGQGAPLGARTCYLASDSTFKTRDKTAVAAADIEHALEKLKSQRFCAFIDINLKGFDAGKEAIPEPNPEDFFKTYLGGEDNEDQTPPPGRVVFLATNGLRPSLDLEKHGVFAQAVLNGLKAAADKEGYEPDGLVTVDELVEFLGKEIPELTRKHGKTKEEKEQFHHILGGRTNHFPITFNPAAHTKAQGRLAKFDKLAKDKKLTAEVVEEGQRLLGRMPKLIAQQDLRKDYQKLADGTLSVDEFLKNRATILASTRLKRSEAMEFATKVMAAIRILRDAYVKELNQGELVGWAIRGLFVRLDERRTLDDAPDELKEKLKKVKDLKETELIQLLADYRERLGRREDLENNKDVDTSLGAMMRHLDPYTNYIDAETKKRFDIETRGQFTGIGIQIRKDVARDMLMVVTPIKNSPAYKAGILAGDIIAKIIREVDSEGKPLDKPEELSTKGLPLSDAVKKILGKAGTNVKLVIEREGEKKPLEFEITRGRVEVETVLGHKRKTDDTWDYVIDPETRICYVRLTSFANNSYRDLQRVVKQLEAEGIKGMIFDLRFNPGGLLKSAVQISDLFIDDGLIVSIRPRVGRPESYRGEHDGSYTTFPMVCLVNGGSASGSEIVAACLQDHHRAVVMGERSYGKGSVQTIQPFAPTEGEIKLTTASFWRPSGRNLNRSSTKGTESEDWGVIPDKGYVLKLTPKERDDLAEHQRDTEIISRKDLPPKETKPTYKDKQLEQAIEYLRVQIKMAGKLPVKKAG